MTRKKKGKSRQAEYHRPNGPKTRPEKPAHTFLKTHSPEQVNAQCKS